MWHRLTQLLSWVFISQNWMPFCVRNTSIFLGHVTNHSPTCVKEVLSNERNSSSVPQKMEGKFGGRKWNIQNAGHRLKLLRVHLAFICAWMCRACVRASQRETILGVDKLVFTSGVFFWKAWVTAMDLNDKATLVTGGASGIGKSIVEEFIKHGARVRGMRETVVEVVPCLCGVFHHVGQLIWTENPS